MHTYTKISFTTTLLLTLSFCLLTTPLAAQSNNAQPAENTPYVVEKLGETIPLDLTFTNSDGEEISLREFIKLPTVLSLVYYRCPSICSPLLQELADNVDKCDDLTPGTDYQLVTISFDPREDEQLSSVAHNTIVGGLKTKIPPESWVFMTGNEENIKTIANAVGFGYVKDKDDFMHSATIMFISPEGKIVRYIQGLDFLPADLQSGIIDAKFGRTSKLMKRVQQFCFNYDPQSKAMVLNINRLIIATSFFIMGLFILYLAFAKKKSQPAPEIQTPNQDNES